MKGGIIHDHHLIEPQLWQQAFLDPSVEAFGIGVSHKSLIARLTLADTVDGGGLARA